MQQSIVNRRAKLSVVGGGINGITIVVGLSYPILSRYR